MIIWSIEYKNTTKGITFSYDKIDMAKDKSLLNNDKHTPIRVLELIKIIQDKLEEGGGFIVKFHHPQEDLIDMKALQRLVKNELAVELASHGIFKKHSIIIQNIELFYLMLRMHVI